MSQIKTGFDSEKQMTLLFDQFLQKFRNARLVTTFPEFDGVWGIPDFLIITGPDEAQCIIAVELKIKNWRRAMQQAFRYKGFADFAFVIIDHTHLKKALQNIELFQRYNIGLGSLDTSKKLLIHFSPKYEPPFSNSHFNLLIHKLAKKEIEVPLTRNLNSTPVSDFFNRYVSRELSAVQ